MNKKALLNSVSTTNFDQATFESLASDFLKFPVHLLSVIDSQTIVVLAGIRNFAIDLSTLNDWIDSQNKKISIENSFIDLSHSLSINAGAVNKRIKV